MRYSIIAAVAAAGVLAACGQADDSSQSSDMKLESERAKVSYAIGLDVGRTLKGLETDIDMEAFDTAVRDRMNDRQARLDPEEAKRVLQAFFRERARAKAAEREAAAEANRKAGEAFLAGNAKRAGVKTTASGLQYEVRTEGAGAMPESGDEVTVHYRGTLVDGTVFDSSYDRGEPATFPVDGVIEGWSEALKLMRVGGEYRLVIPSDLAYGERGAGGKIGPEETLIFDVELLDVKRGDGEG